eukprot:6200451-Pleurochrysis_carterae.AAC.3
MKFEVFRGSQQSSLDLSLPKRRGGGKLIFLRHQTDFTSPIYLYALVSADDEVLVPKFDYSVRSGPERGSVPIAYSLSICPQLAAARGVGGAAARVSGRREAGLERIT